MIFQPMLAAKTDGKLLDRLTYPRLASPKFDGIRAVVIDGRVMSRKLKPIPNLHVQDAFGRSELEGLDGELIVGKPTAPDVYTRTMSGVMAVEGEPMVTFYVFDQFKGVEGRPYSYRLAGVKDRVRQLQPTYRHPTFFSRLEAVEHVNLRTREELDDYETRMLGLGYEGVMLRSPDGHYKFGRSTFKEGGLLKVKRFEDGEARVLGAVEQLHNTNEAVRNQVGQLERSSKKTGKVSKGILGALQVKDLKTGVEFEIGTGFTDADRVQLWTWYQTGDEGDGNEIPLEGQIVKYKYQPAGVKDKPRFPVFIGFRHKDDM